MDYIIWLTCEIYSSDLSFSSLVDVKACGSANGGFWVQTSIQLHLPLEFGILQRIELSEHRLFRVSTSTESCVLPSTCSGYPTLRTCSIIHLCWDTLLHCVNLFTVILNWSILYSIYCSDSFKYTNLN